MKSGLTILVFVFDFRSDENPEIQSAATQLCFSKSSKISQRLFFFLLGYCSSSFKGSSDINTVCQASRQMKIARGHIREKSWPLQIIHYSEIGVFTVWAIRNCVKRRHSYVVVPCSSRLKIRFFRVSTNIQQKYTNRKK